MEFYSVIKKNEIVLLLDKWMALENIRLSDVRQVQTDKGRMYTLVCGKQIQIQIQTLLCTHTHTHT
jgi:hypothetical protein